MTNIDNLLVQKLDALIEVQNRTAVALEAIAQATAPAAPNYRHPFEQYSNFDWSCINAQVLAQDQYGATAVSWNGYTWKRRSWPTKYGLVIGFSRADGMGEDGVNWLTLITFKKMTAVEALPEKVRQAIRTGANGRQPAGQTDSEPGVDLFEYRYQDGTEAQSDKEKTAFRQYKRAHHEQAPADKASLRTWYQGNKEVNI
jgi:hypothetical protein